LNEASPQTKGDVKGGKNTPGSGTTGHPVRKWPASVEGEAADRDPKCKKMLQPADENDSALGEYPCKRKSRRRGTMELTARGTDIPKEGLRR